MKKLLNKKGESLVESLVSILIFTLSSIMLYTMLSTATEMNRKVKEISKAYQEQMVYAEQAEGGVPVEQAVTFKYVHGGTETPLFEYDASDNVKLYRLDENSLYSYALD